MLTSTGMLCGMANAVEDRIANLLLARCAAALSLAIVALEFADPCQLPGGHPSVHEFADVEELEEVTLALLRHGGVSWDVLAAYRGVSRQAMHRKFAHRVDVAAEIAQGMAALHREEIRSELSTIQEFAAHLSRSLDLEHAEAVQTWVERRRTPGWWRDSAV
jgi:hypothetical protein